MESIRLTKPTLPRILQKDLEEAEDIDFTETQENWNTYTLEDGTTLKIKTVLQGVKRLNKWKPDGTPIYLVSTSNIVRTVNVPKDLKAKPKVSSFKPV